MCTLGNGIGITCKNSSKPSLVNSYCRCTRKFMSSTECTTMLMNCIQATCKTKRGNKNYVVQASLILAPWLLLPFPLKQGTFKNNKKIMVWKNNRQVPLSFHLLIKEVRKFRKKVQGHKRKHTTSKIHYDPSVRNIWEGWRVNWTAILHADKLLESHWNIGS